MLTKEMLKKGSDEFLLDAVKQVQQHELKTNDFKYKVNKVKINLIMYYFNNHDLSKRSQKILYYEVDMFHFNDSDVAD